MGSSSSSFSLLPATPKILNGREAELRDLVDTLNAVSARVAILGPGGIGKSTLAMAALHNEKVVDAYPTRHYISCDSALTNEALVTTITLHLGLAPSRGSAKHVLHYLMTGPPCLVILDNFETPWEPLHGRAKVEEFLSLLTDIPHVALLVWPLLIP